MIADSGRRNNCEDFIDGAYTARQGNEYIALFHHQLFTVTQVIAGDLNLHIITRPSRLLDNHRNDADGPSASLLRGLAERLHQSLVHTSIHKGIPITGCPPSQLLRHREEIRINLLIRRTEYTYLHNCLQS